MNTKFWYQNLAADIAAYLKNGIILQATIRRMLSELPTKWYQKKEKVIHLSTAIF